MIRHIVFFNTWHLGDLFTTREWVKHIIQQTPDCVHAYAHKHAAKLTQDMCAHHPQSDQLTERLNTYARAIWDAATQTLFINTWVGAYHEHFEGHPSYLKHHDIIRTCYDVLREPFALNLTWNPDPWYYVPRINYVKYHMNTVHEFVLKHDQPKILFCNNDVKSRQSSMGDMQEIIQHMAQLNPDHVLIVTKKLPLTLPNVVYTQDLFQVSNDLIETSYLSHYCDMIVGKNSGAHTYTQTYQNLKNPRKKFVCFSHDVNHTLPHALNVSCVQKWSNQLDTQACVHLLQETLHA